MFSITKEFTFCASHAIPGLPEGHKCGRVHGHNYRVQVTLSCAGLDRRGFVTDFGDLAPVGQWLAIRFDHRHLNDVLPADMPPTSEALARYIFEAWKPELPLLRSVTVKETDTTGATYEYAA